MMRYKKVRDILGNEVFIDTKTNKEYLIDWSSKKPTWILLKRLESRVKKIVK